MKRPALTVFLVILGLLFIAAAAAGGLIWWKISSLKQELITSLASSLNAKVDVASLTLDPWKGEVKAAGISLENLRPEAPWDTAAIDQAVGHFHLMDLFSPTLPMRIEVSNWKVSLHTTASANVVPPSDSSASAQPTFLPPLPGNKQISVTDLSATGGEVTLRSSDGTSVLIHGVMFNSGTQSGAEWTTQLETSSITAGTMTTGAGSVHLHSDKDKITFNDLSIHCGDGQVTGSGDVALAAPHAVHGTFQAAAVPITTLVGARWQLKLSGLVTGNLVYQGDDASATATGKISVAGGKFNVLPWLGKVTSLVGLPDVAGVELDQATADFTWKNHAFKLQNIDIRKEGVMRVAGEFTVSATDQCDGPLKLGLPSTVISKWPKLQTDVFSTASDNYNWADVHVTGTPDNLQEDLTPRLLSVGAEQGVDLIKQGTQKATDLLNSLLK